MTSDSHGSKQLTAEELWALWQKGPMLLLIDLSEAREQFENKTKFLIFYDYDTEDLVDNMMDYLMDNETAEGTVAEYIDELLELYGPASDSEHIAILGDCIEQLSKVILKELRGIGAYAPNGHLWYKYKYLIGGDLILEKQPLDE